jgi:hypothetical protein
MQELRHIRSIPLCQSWLLLMLTVRIKSSRFEDLESVQSHDIANVDSNFDVEKSSWLIEEWYRQ